jgi:hypothetical protein
MIHTQGGITMSLCDWLSEYRATWTIHVAPDESLKQALQKFLDLVRQAIDEQQDKPSEFETYFVVKGDPTVALDQRFQVIRVCDLIWLASPNPDNGVSDENFNRPLVEYSLPNPVRVVEEGALGPSEVRDLLLSLPTATKAVVIVDANELLCVLVSGHLAPGVPVNSNVINGTTPRTLACHGGNQSPHCEEYPPSRFLSSLEIKCSRSTANHRCRVSVLDRC